jgi:hypothetical protein
MIVAGYEAGRRHFWWPASRPVTTYCTISQTFFGFKIEITKIVIVNETDDDRVYLNSGAGNYSSPVQRQLMSNVSGQDYIIPLHTLFDEASVSLSARRSRAQKRP